MNNYRIYEKPSKKYLEIENPPNTGFPDTEEPNTENPPQINTKEQNTNKQKDIIDKIDKKDNEIIHNILTLEFIQNGYLKETDELYLYDSLFKEYINNGYTYKRLLKVVTYVVKKVSERNYKDEHGELINDKYRRIISLFKGYDPIYFYILQRYNFLKSYKD